MGKPGASLGFGLAELGTKEGLGAGDKGRRGGRLGALGKPGASLGFGLAEL